MAHKFLQLALDLARHWVAITWMGQRAPDPNPWYSDIGDWASAEELHVKQIRHDNKVMEDLEVWRVLFDKLLNPEVSAGASDNDSITDSAEDDTLGGGGGSGA
ncbi:hypothetical protein NDU88_008658 [Pleurodeles waltl]|uniref:Uncharacterized protein n=1 Tax=Pleurodeles waltl TaxID=8319 RepID=A0AAV7P480_PLEWA|nr:hypothetical protein NDU88_008658 [Pleurodeles waltl]